MGISYLLDTHILLWWLFNDPKLNAECREIIRNPAHSILVSSVTAWEIRHQTRNPLHLFHQWSWHLSSRYADSIGGIEGYIDSRYVVKQQGFLDFVLEQYVKAGVGELDRSKLPQLLELKYHAIRDAVAELGSVGSISEIFIGFQEYLYTRDRAV